MPADRIFIYGVPGSGKTFLSKILAKHLGLPVIEADSLKKTARKGYPKSEVPFLYLGTCQAYRQFGELSQNTAIQGLLAVRSALSRAVQAAVLNRDSYIIEGAFLDPTELICRGSPILVTAADEQIHRKYFLRHREKLFDREQFQAARIIQDYFIDEAKRLKHQERRQWSNWRTGLSCQSRYDCSELRLAKCTISVVLKYVLLWGIFCYHGSMYKPRLYFGYEIR